MEERQPTSAATDATIRAAAPPPAETEPSGPTITLPKSVADQITLAAGLDGAGATPEGLARPTFRSRYEIGQELGHGGMGVVYAAMDRDLGRTVAMKLMQGLGADDREQAARFIREVQTTAQLEHPNIMPVYDVGLSSEGCLYYTMKLVRGKTLSAVLRGFREKREDQSIPRLLGMFLQIANGVAYAHAKGVLHRDIKPENVMLGEHGEVVVMDWGLAKILGTREKPLSDGGVRVRAGGTLAGTVIGTPAYMAPEQARGEMEAIGPHTDVYALGAILYEMLTLRPPFLGTDSHDILSRVLEGAPPPPPRSLNLAVGRGLNAIVRKAMAPEPSSRYASCDGLAEDVGRYLEGKPVAAYQDGVFDRLARAARRYRRRMVLGGTVALVCLLGVATLLFAARKRAEGRAMRFLDQARTAARGIHQTTAPFDLRMGAYSDARRLCDKALAQAPNLEQALRTRAEVMIDFAQAAVERHEFDLASTLILEVEALAERWDDLSARVAALGERLTLEHDAVRHALDEVFSQVRNREIPLVFTEEGIDSLPPAVDARVGTLRGRWSIDACLARLKEEQEDDAVRAVAALLLAHYGAREEGVLAVLRDGLAPGTPSTLLVSCAEALGALGDVGSLPTILARLSEAIPKAEEPATQILRLYGQFLAATENRVPVTHRLGVAILRFGPEAAPEVERRLLSASATTNERTVGYLLLARLGGAAGVRAVLHAAKDETVGGIGLGVELAGVLDAASVAASRPACDALLEGLGDGIRPVRALCLHIIAGMRGQDPVQQAFAFVVEHDGQRMSFGRGFTLPSVTWPEDVRRKAVGAAEGMLDDGSPPQTRIAAIRVLAIARTPEAERDLVARLSDEDPTVRQTALAGLGDASPEVVPDLLAAASAASGPLRERLLEIGENALKGLRWAWKPSRKEIPEEARKAILKGIKEGSGKEALLSVGAAGLFGLSEAFADLQGILAGKGDATLRRRAAVSIGRLGDPSCLPMLQGLLKRESDPAVREGVALALARFRRPESLGALVEALRYRDYESAANIRAAILEVVGDDAARVAEMLALEKTDPAWISLATVLARIPGEAATLSLSELSAAEKGKNPMRHLHAEALLFERGDASRLSSVLSALVGDSEEVRTEAHRRLRAWFHVDCGSEAGRWKDWWEQHRAKLEFDPETESFARAK